MPDGGNVAGKSRGVNVYTYFHYAQTDGSENLFSLNRILPSPGMFGSLPASVKGFNPSSGEGSWETLLLRPPPGHPGTSAPHDHNYLDLFWMPVVEPYAISEPFSTAGKVNMNYQIFPLLISGARFGRCLLPRQIRPPPEFSLSPSRDCKIGEQATD